MKMDYFITLTPDICSLSCTKSVLNNMTRSYLKNLQFQLDSTTTLDFRYNAEVNVSRYSHTKLPVVTLSNLATSMVAEWDKLLLCVRKCWGYGQNTLQMVWSLLEERDEGLFKPTW